MVAAPLWTDAGQGGRVRVLRASRQATRCNDKADWKKTWRRLELKSRTPPGTQAGIDLIAHAAPKGRPKVGVPIGAHRGLESNRVDLRVGECTSGPAGILVARDFNYPHGLPRGWHGGRSECCVELRSFTPGRKSPRGPHTKVQVSFLLRRTAVKMDGFSRPLGHTRTTRKPAGSSFSIPEYFHANT